jgi:hypothetical protein
VEGLGEEPSHLHPGDGTIPECGQRGRRLVSADHVSFSDLGGERIERPGRRRLGPDCKGPGARPQDHRPPVVPAVQGIPPVAHVALVLLLVGVQVI